MTASADAGYTKTYTLDNAAPGERKRLAEHEVVWDGNSQSHLLRLGLEEGSTVLMVAGGGGALVEWVADRVGPSGAVTTTDLDIRFLQPLQERYPHVTVEEHNVVTQPLPTDAFDIVHTRLLVAHLPEREAVIAKMMTAVRPGGWLMIEDFDAASLGPAYPNEDSTRALLANRDFLLANGYDPYTGRRLPGIMRGLGLAEVDAVGVTFTLRGSQTTLPSWYLKTFRNNEQRMIAEGYLTSADADALAKRYEDPNYDGLVHTMMTVWGRKPLLTAH